MTQEFFFKHAKWIGGPVRTPKTFSVLRGHFCGDNVIAIQYGGGWYTCKLRSLILKSCCEVFALQRLFPEKLAAREKIDKIIPMDYNNANIFLSGQHLLHAAMFL